MPLMAACRRPRLNATAISAGDGRSASSSSTTRGPATSTATARSSRRFAGIRAARDKARRSGNHGLKVGCNSSPLFGPGAGFLTELTRAGGGQFVDDLDYIGLDFFPDVFRPIAPASLDGAVQALLEAHRRDRLARAGLGHLPLIITEHGWPTGPGRPAGRQAEVLAAVIDVISRNARALNITGYIHHTLRDARSAGSGLFDQFGLMTDDYTPKPAFHVYRDLIDAHYAGRSRAC
jgi:hypothetical protein